jgi:phosphatidylglycerol---prolipoprotein diacylglyceryl transferase
MSVPKVIFPQGSTRGTRVLPFAICNLKFQFSNLQWVRVHPIAIQLGTFSIHWYGILTAAGFLLGLWTASRRGLRGGISADAVMDFAPWLMLGVIVGARFLHVVTYWREEFAHEPWTEVFMIQRGGLVFYGGFIGATIALLIYVRRKKLPFLKFADVLAPSLALGHAFGRIGCLMTGCCFGKQCSLPWAVHFPPGHETHPVGSAGMGVHPTQIYESILNLCLYFFLAWLYRRKKFDGQILAAYLLCYAVLRSFVEIFRADYKASEYFFNGALSPGQFVSIGIFAAGLILFWSKSPKRRTV